MAGDEHRALGVITVGQRNTGVSRGAAGRRNAGHYLKRHARGFGRFQFFAAAPENKRVAAFQAHHGFALAGEINQHLVGLMLRHRVRARAFPDTDAVGVATHQIQHAVAHQMVVKHDIRLLHHLQTAQRQQPGVAGARAHQNDFALRALRRVQFGFQHRFGGAGVACGHQARKAAAKGFFPEATASVGRGNTRFNTIAKTTRDLGHPSEACRQQRFDFLAQQSRQHRRVAAGGDSDDERRAVDNRRKNKRAQRLIVHHVDQALTGVSLIKDPAVERGVVGRRNNQKHRVELRRLKRRGQPAQRAFLLQRRQLRMQFFRHDRDAGARTTQQRDFTQRHFAAADDQHRALFQLSK
ncbi:hypothetical protein BN132_1565 [Cronobacter turicensis 564]|nr:hypothetical protein BN132_1565 [Cronobacter turicensis 564]